MQLFRVIIHQVFRISCKFAKINLIVLGMKKIFLVLLFVPFFFSCNDENEDEDFEHYVDIATVENPSQATEFIFTLDDSTRLKAINSLIPYYRPKDGQRIIVDYSLYYTNRDTTAYDYLARINDVYEILTKGIFQITPETEDSIGNDYIHIDRMWIGSHYLNIEFVYPAYDKTHFINLVSDTSKTYTDGKIHLEFRHNANGDYPNFNRWGIVSFDIKSLENNSAGDTLKLVIHSREYNNTTMKEYPINYIYGSQPSDIKPNREILKYNFKLNR